MSNEVSSVLVSYPQPYLIYKNRYKQIQEDRIAVHRHVNMDQYQVRIFHMHAPSPILLHFSRHGYYCVTLSYFHYKFETQRQCIDRWLVESVVAH